MDQDTRTDGSLHPAASESLSSPRTGTVTFACNARLPRATGSLSGDRTRPGSRSHLGGHALALVGLLIAAIPVQGLQDTSPPGDRVMTTQTPAFTHTREARLARLEARRAYWRKRVSEARRHLESWYQRRLVRITEIRNIASARRDQDALDRLARLEAKLETIHRRRTELLDRAAARIDG